MQARERFYAKKHLFKADFWNFNFLLFYILELFTNRKYIYFSIYSTKRKNALSEVLSYGYPMVMLWLSYGINSQFTSLLTTD